MFGKHVRSGFAPVLINGLTRCNYRVACRGAYSSSPTKVATTVLRTGTTNYRLVFAANNVDMSPSSHAPLTVGGANTRVVACNTPILPNTVFLIDCLSNIPIYNLPNYIVCTGHAVFSLLLPHLLTSSPVATRSVTQLNRNKLYLNYTRYR